MSTEDNAEAVGFSICYEEKVHFYQINNQNLLDAILSSNV